MKKKFLAALDQSTTGTKFKLYDLYGKEILASSRPHKQIINKPGLVEHNPIEIWKNTKIIIKEAMKKFNGLADIRI